MFFSNCSVGAVQTDVIMQQTFRQSRTIEEGKIFYSAKHKLYG